MVFLLVLGGVRLAFVLAFAFSVYLLAAGSLALILYPFRGTDLAREVECLGRRLTLREDRRRALQAASEDCRGNYYRLLEVRAAEQAYEDAWKQHQEMAAKLRSRRNELRLTDWRSLRDKAFEAFLADVFRELGYTVEETKTTGDQGADLVLTCGGRRIAVQAKGWENSVGNKAIMEVLGGKAFYHCTECVVVTNSRFTSPARDLAQSADCLLIDGERIPDLIEGRIL
jgi:restriction system protein